jgi:outer membrane lipoprotein carrier protein
MKRLLLILPLLLATIAIGDPPTTAPTAKPASQELLERVQKQLQDVNTVQADFVQSKKLAVMNHLLVIKGRFALEKPDHVIWIATSPVKYAVSVKGDEVRQWDEDTNQVQVMHLGGDPTFKAISDQINSWFMGDYKKLAEGYDVTVAHENPLTLAFAPKGNSMVAKMLKQIEVTFGKESKYIDTMVIRETSGSVTTLKYSNVRINEPIGKETWEIPPHDR